jgi:hypothetical protein
VVVQQKESAQLRIRNAVRLLRASELAVFTVLVVSGSLLKSLVEKDLVHLVAVKTLRLVLTFLRDFALNLQVILLISALLVRLLQNPMLIVLVLGNCVALTRLTLLMQLEQKFLYMFVVLQLPQQLLC